MYVWITARRIRPGMMNEFLRLWHDPDLGMPVSPAEPQGPDVYRLHPTDDPNEMWGMGMFDSLELVEQFRNHPNMQRRAEALAPFVEEVLWERVLEGHSWTEFEKPIYYAVYIRTHPAGRFRIAAICDNARGALEQADVHIARACAEGCEGPEWTMRAFQSPEDAPNILPPTELGHTHYASSGQASAASSASRLR